MNSGARPEKWVDGYHNRGNLLSFGPGLFSTLGKYLLLPVPITLWLNITLFFCSKGSLLLIQRISSNFLRHRSQGSCSPITLSLSLIHIQLRVFITNQVRDGPQEVWFNYPSIFFSWKILYFDTQIELLSWMTRTALELIGQSGFGYSFDSMTETSVPHLYALSVKRYVWVLFLHAT